MMDHQRPPTKIVKRYANVVIPASSMRPAAAATSGALSIAALLDRLFSGLRDDPATRASAIRLLEKIEAEEDAAIAAANPGSSHEISCPECGHQFRAIIPDTNLQPNENSKR